MIIESKRSNLVFHFDPRDGDIRERVTGARPTVVGSPIFGKGRNGYGVRGVGTGYLEWAANALWDVTNVGTFVFHYLPCTLAFSGLTQFVAGRISLTPSTLNGFCFTANSGSPAISFADAVSVNTITVTGGTPTRPDESAIVGAAWNAGGTMKAFLDGERTNSQAYTRVPSPSGQVFRVCGFSALPFISPIMGVYLFNAELTEIEMSQFYEELNGSYVAPRTKAPVLRRPMPAILSSTVIALAEKQRPGRGIPNLANAAKPGTISGQSNISPNGFMLLGDASINVGDVTGLNSANEWTLEAVVTHLAANAAGSGIISKTTSTNSRIALELTNAANPAGIVAAVKNGSDTYGTVASVIRFGQPTHLAERYSGAGSANADRLKVFVNGEEENVSFTGTIPATGPSLAGTHAIVGDVVIGAAHQYENGVITAPCAHSVALSATAIKDRYLAWARTPVFERGGAARWLLASVGGVGSVVPDDGWICESTTAVTETLNSGNRVFNSSGNTSTFRTRCMPTIGTWKFLISSTGNACEVDFIRGFAKSANTGYTAKIVGGNLVLALQGGATLLTGAGSLASGQLYWVWITRNHRGRFDVWTRALTDASWTSVGTATDTTTFAGGHFGFTLGTNAQFGRRVIVYPGPIKPGEVPALDLAT